MKTMKLIQMVILLLLIFSQFTGNLHSAIAQSVEADNKVSFLALDQNEISLQGPLDTKSFTFRIPADWKMLAGGQLHLDFSAFFDNGNASANGGGIPAAGYLQVAINGFSVGTITVNQRGENSVDIPIPTTVWSRVEPTSSSHLEFNLRTPGPCNTAFLNNGNVVGGLSLSIHPASYFTLPHETNPLVADLRQLPYPIFQDSFIPDSAVLIVPDAPSDKELQASLVTSAVLGRLSARALLLEMTTVGKLDPDWIADSHLIFVGLPSAFPQLSQANWPIQDLGAEELGIDDGIVQMSVSPQNPSKVWLMVSGNTDSGVLKAAQALESGKNIRVNSNPSLSVVTDTRVSLIDGAEKIDNTFADLGYRNQDSHGPGIRYSEYLFNIPSGMTVGTGAYLDLAYAHSAMLDFDGAGLSVSLNGDYIGSLRFSAQDAQVSKWHLNLPSSSFVPGENRLLISANLVPVSSCLTTNQLWFTSRSDSALHLPLEEAMAEAPKLLLRKYPRPFFPDLDQTAFILSKSDPISWNIASKIAFDLGGKIRGSVSSPVVVFAESIPESIRNERDLLIIGRPTLIPILQELAPAMPAPYEQGSDIATEPSQDIVFDVPADTPVGYLQVFGSPWNTNKSVLAVTGNGDNGLKLAGDVLTIPEQFSELAGNFAVVYENQIIPVEVKTGKATVLATPVVVESQSMQPNEGPATQPAVSSPKLNLVVFPLLLLFGLAVIGFLAWRIIIQRGKA